MSKIDVCAVINVYEIDGKETKFQERQIRVKSHWNRDTLVVIDFGPEKATLTVSRDELLKALNAVNCGYV